MPYVRKGVVYEGPTLKRGRKSKKAAIVVIPKTKSATVSKPVKKAINRAIAQQEEVKVAVLEVFKQLVVPGAGLDAGSNLGLYTSGVGAVPSSILPNVPLGTDDASRIGAVIRPKRLIVKYTLRGLDTTGNTTGTNPFRGKPFLCRIVIYNHRYSIEDTTNNAILDKGATTGNIDSSPDSWLERYNKREYKIWYSKTFKMAALSDTGTTPPTVENMPNGCQYFAMGRISVNVPKQLVYNTTNLKASNFAPKMAICMCNMDGSLVSNIQYRVISNVESQLYYTDA